MHHQLTPLADETRKQFHAIFNDWMVNASDADFGKLETAKTQYAPFQVCSMVTLVRGCLANQDLRSALPETLVQLLRERNWLRPSSAAIAA
jgi:hypothetical protein